MDETYTRLACVGCGDRCAHKECKACGKTFTVKRDRNHFCSAACRNADRSRSLCTCTQCGVQYKPKKAAYSTFCGRECYFKHKGSHKAVTFTGKPFCNVYFPACAICGAVFTARASNQVRCGKACDKVHACRDAQAKAIARFKQDGRVVQCQECDSRFCPLYGSSQSVLCSPCSESRKRAQRKAAKLLRKLREKANKIEPVDPIKVFERDGWKCNACGVATPKAKRGTYDADAPELDHIHPLSKGGAHSYENTQCLCRGCNGAKSDSLEPLPGHLKFPA